MRAGRKARAGGDEMTQGKEESQLEDDVGWMSTGVGGNPKQGL